MKTVLIGSVDSSWIVLEEMIAQHFPPELVFSLDERYSENV
jgi:methionyl-tRNA formyltransferase